VTPRLLVLLAMAGVATTGCDSSPQPRKTTEAAVTPPPPIVSVPTYSVRLIGDVPDGFIGYWQENCSSGLPSSFAINRRELVYYRETSGTARVERRSDDRLRIIPSAGRPFTLILTDNGSVLMREIAGMMTVSFRQCPATPVE
jgi:hypothetical protein